MDNIDDFDMHFDTKYKTKAGRKRSESPKRKQLRKLASKRMDFSKLILCDKYDSIKAMLKNIMFFKERQIEDETLSLIIKKLSYERFNKDDVVIEYGDEGEKFFIILSGSVQIFIPEHPEFLNSKNNASDASMNIVNTFLKKLTSKNRRKTLRNKFNFPKLQDLCSFKLVGTFGVGKSFGERALLENRKRTARVKCAEDCEFAVMTCKDFKDVLATIESERIKKIKLFLEGIPIFKGLNRKHITSVYFKTEIIPCNFKQNIINIGDTIPNLYIVYEGEFEETTKLKIIKEPEFIVGDKVKVAENK